MHEISFAHINLTMARKSYVIYDRKYFSRNKDYGWERLTRFRGIKIGDIILYLLPLLLVMIFIPPLDSSAPKEPMGSGSDIAVDSPVKIIVYNPEESLIDEFYLEDYVTGVVAAEMPAAFHEEALKAQAVAARTFALSRMKGLYGSNENHFGAHVCTEPNHCQAWISRDRFLMSHGDEKAWEKIKKAAEATENVVMTYDGILINPLYHSNSGGVTEDVEAVWNVSGEVPYLKSVYSVDESQYDGFEKKVSFSWDEIKERLKSKYSKDEVESKFSREIEILSYSSSGRVKEIRIGSIKMPGTEFRELLSLRSTNLKISFPDPNTVEITTKGYGHGVGMSQCGADALAKKGYDYIKILEYYYTGISVEKMNQ